MKKNCSFKHSLIKTKLAKSKTQAFLSLDFETNFWISRLNSSSAIVLVTPTKIFYLVREIDFLLCKNINKDIEVVLIKNIKDLIPFFKKLKIKKLLCNEDHITISQKNKYSR